MIIQCYYQFEKPDLKNENFYTWNLCPKSLKFQDFQKWYYHDHSFYSWNPCLRVTNLEKRNLKKDVIKIHMICI